VRNITSSIKWSNYRLQWIGHGHVSGQLCHFHRGVCELAAENLGISNFVYRATRPFSEKKLMSRVIDVWPIPQKDLLSLTDYSKAPIEDEEDGRSQPTNSSFASVLRSKGWVTLDQYPNQGIYWTHAGRHLGLELVPSMNNSDDEMASIGQEVVFIGMKMNESKITQELDNCLLNDEELIRYHERVKARTDPRLQEVERPRFGVGTMVQALTGPDTWEVGRVVAVHYREPTWPDGKYAPYQIELNGGDLIYAPADIDSIIRAV
jgi:hypothetical protein